MVEIKQAIQKALEQAEKAFASAGNAEQLEQLRVEFLGKKGSIKQLSKGLKDVGPDDRPAIGQAINEAKQRATIAFDQAKARIAASKKGVRQDAGAPDIDITLPGRRHFTGRVHPINQVWREIEEIFIGMGFTVEHGPEVETEWYNFEALNFPKDHPARDIQDTLFVEGGLVMRTHTSPVQIRLMERQKPPIQMICPGWVFRNDAIDATHSPMFSQVEGLMVDEHITFGDLKGVLNEFVRRFFGQKFKTRFRPSFFPFTEPSAEVDVQCFVCGGDGTTDGAPCRVCKGTGWTEILGSGMVHVNVFKAVGYDPEKYTGFAFGMGIDRIAMFRYGVDEIRRFFEGDLRFLRQF